MNDIKLWFADNGDQYVIPDDVWAATQFRKDGWPDKRVKANAAFYEWLKTAEPLAEPKAKLATFTAPASADTKPALDVVQVYVDPLLTAAAQAYANRVWEGQSVSADRVWRIERVKQALEGQGLPFEGVVLP